MRKIRNGILTGLALGLLLSAAAAAADEASQETAAPAVTETANEAAPAAADTTAADEAAPAAADTTAADEAAPAAADTASAEETAAVQEMEAAGPGGAPAEADTTAAEEAVSAEAGTAAADEAAAAAADTASAEETAAVQEMEAAGPEGAPAAAGAAAADEPASEELTESADVPMLLAAAAPKELPDSYVTVTWTRMEGGEEIQYTQGQNDEEIRSISDGVWELYVQVHLDAAGMDPLVDGTYTYTLVWPDPEGKQASLAGGGTGGEIQFGSTAGSGSWELGPDGLLTFTFQDIGSLGGGAYGWISAFVTVAEEETGLPGDVPAHAQIEKEGVYDAAAQCVIWKAAATVPAWDGKETYSWCIEDTLKMVPSYWPESFQNDYSQMSIACAVSGSNIWKEVPAAADAQASDEVAWLYEQKDDGTAVIWFLNRCSCGPGFCQSAGGVCENVKASDASGTAWCSCWHQIQNLDFALSYSGDTGELEQQIQDSGESEVQLINEADLMKNKMVADDAEAMVIVHGAIEKLEAEAPGKDNGYSSTCTVRVNDSYDDYSRADRIEVTDVMENLTYTDGSMQITYRNADQSAGTLSEIAREEAQALAREGNENCYYSLDCREDESLLITLWYPTQAAYEITYRAAVTDLVQGGITQYRNTASLGKVSSTAEGRGFRVDDDWFAEEFEATIYKVDARSSGDDPQMLSGAEFEVWQYVEDGEDLLIDTLTTGEDGTAVFRTRREDGVLIYRNTLYCLLESRAPEGYEKNEEKYYFYFSPDEDMVLPETIPALCGTDGSLTLRIEDEPIVSAKLPGTGGPGNALFFALGLFLIFALRGVPALAERKH